MNKLYQEINKAPSNNQNNTLNNHTSYSDVMKEIQESGLTAKELFFEKAKKMGIDPMSILSKIR